MGNVQKTANSTTTTSTIDVKTQTTATTNTAAVTVPVAKSVPAGTTVSESNKGLEVEKTTTTETSPETTLKAEKKINTKTETKKPSKSGPGLDETLTKFYGKKYTEASEEEKEKLIVRYFDWLSKDKKDVISQLDQFKLYRDRCASDEEYKRLSSVIDKMEAKYQLNAATTVVTEGTENQKDIGTKAVADDYQNYDKSVQTDVAQLISDTKNQEAIKTAASHASETDATNQTKVVDIFSKTYTNENGEVTDANKKAQNSINKILIDQYGSYAKENQLNIHKIFANSTLEETQVYAASNIYHFDKDNQAAAVRITSEAGNEAAIQAAAEQYGNYDKSARDEIKSIIQDSSCEAAQEALEQAEAESEVQGKTQEIAETQEVLEAEIAEAKAQKAEEKNHLSQENKTVAEKIEDIIKSKAFNKNASIREVLKNASEADKMTLLERLSKTELVSVLNILLTGGASMSILSKAIKLLGNFDNKNQKEIAKKVNSSFSSKVITSQMSTFNSDLQSIFVQESAKKGNIDNINRSFLSGTAKIRYDELNKGQGCGMT